MQICCFLNSHLHQDFTETFTPKFLNCFDHKKLDVKLVKFWNHMIVILGPMSIFGIDIFYGYLNQSLIVTSISMK